MDDSHLCAGNFGSIVFSCIKCPKVSTNFRKKGNELYTKQHVQDSHMKILSLYTTSIALAPNNSEELAMGYGNRSALLMHIQKHEECIADIDRALSISKSDKLKAKLSSRKDLCLKLMNQSNCNSQKTAGNNDEITGKFELPKMIPSKKVPCVAESLTLKYDQKYGMHMEANQDIRPGEIIASEEAYVSSPQTSKLYVVCSRCLTQTWNAIPCNLCTVTVYCSETCKNQAWKEYHDLECSVICDPDLIRYPVIRMTVRFFIKIAKSNGLEFMIQEVRKSDTKTFNGSFSCNQLESFLNLKSNEPNFRYDYHISRCVGSLSQIDSIFTAGVRPQFQSEDEMIEFVKQMFTKLLNIIDTNSYQYQGCDRQCIDEDDTRDHLMASNKSINCECRGLIFVPCCSPFNHSCIPNAEALFVDNQKYILISNQPIKKGEQIFTNYYSPYSLQTPKAVRQSLLLENHRFVCECQACTEDWPCPSSDNIGEREVAIMFEILDEHEQICKREGREIVYFDHPETVVYDENTMTQLKNQIELMYKKLDDYRAESTSSLFKLFLMNGFRRHYGLAWKAMDECPKTM